MSDTCSGCGLRSCSGECFDQSEADFDPLWETRKANEEALRRKVEDELRFTMRKDAA